MDTNGYFLSPFLATFVAVFGDELRILFVSVFGDFCRHCGQAFRVACLQRLAGIDPVSLRCWSVQRERGRPGRRLQSPPSERPDDRLTWQCRALCAGVPCVSRKILHCGVNINLVFWLDRPPTVNGYLTILSLMAGDGVYTREQIYRCNSIDGCLRGRYH